MGVIGELPKSLSAPQFVDHVKKMLKGKAIRSSHLNGKRIRRVAVCGGSGSDLADEAIRQEADAFVTADVKYHSFQDAAERILLVDAGHYETEYPVVNSLAEKLRNELRLHRIETPVFATRTSTNPIVYH
jgi:putative NIF3 family GTP cyclohydrolase 1 type 2